MKRITTIIVLLLLVGCSEKEVKIPVLPVKGLQELHDHSQVWIFFKLKNKDTIADVNRNNTIISTHWIYNVDRRLPIKKIANTIEKLKHKHANSMHSKKGKHNYFSYSDTVSKKLSFFIFDSINYKTNISEKQKMLEKDTVYKKIHLYFKKTDVCINNKHYSIKKWQEKLAELLQIPHEKKVKLYLTFDGNMTFQNYLYNRAVIRTVEKVAILCDKNEYIIDESIEDCI